MSKFTAELHHCVKNLWYIYCGGPVGGNCQVGVDYAASCLLSFASPYSRHWIGPLNCVYVVLQIDLYLYAINFKDNQKKPLDFTFTDSLLLKYVTAGFQKIKRQRQLSERVPTSIFYLQSVGDVSLVALLCIFSSFWVNTGALSCRRMRYFTLCDTTNEKTKLSQALTYILI